MIKRHFLTLLDRTPEELQKIIDVALRLKDERKRGIPHRLLEGKSLAMIFEKSSTRTRISFEVGFSELGGYPLFLSAADIQIGRGEPIKDTARVISRYVQCIMMRTFGHERILELAQYASVPIINGLSDSFHPCQIMADIMTMQEVFGNLKGLKVAYVGDGNNMAHSWINGCAQFGMNLSIASPKGYEVDENIYKLGLSLAQNNDCFIELTEDPKRAVRDADIVYTDVWTSMGQEAETKIRLNAFQGYQVDSQLMSLAKPTAYFMHCLPAHRGEEVSEEVVESSRSLIFDEAENRLHIQQAIILDCMLP